jgi:DNA mismatch repair protein MutL
LFSVGSAPFPFEESLGPGQTQWSVSLEEGREGFEREAAEEGSSEFKRGGAFSDLTLLAQIRQVYILAQGEKGLFLIDQHAAHERVLYEKYLRQWDKGGLSSQYLLVPILLDLPPGGLDEPEKIEKVLGPLGFEVGAAGGSSLWIKAIPADLGPEESEAVLRELLEKLKEGEALQDKETLFRSLLKLMACHGAIRAGRSLSRDEIMTLLRQLDQTEQPSHCPHGRPLWFILSWEEIEKRFKRR